jgi:hypothetical protein
VPYLLLRVLSFILRMVLGLQMWGSGTKIRPWWQNDQIRGGWHLHGIEMDYFSGKVSSSRPAIRERYDIC